MVCELRGNLQIVEPESVSFDSWGYFLDQDVLSIRLSLREFHLDVPLAFSAVVVILLIPVPITVTELVKKLIC